MKGIFWQTIEQINECFVEDLHKDWKDATRFMVTIGKESLAVQNTKCSDRYNGLHGLLQAFWMTVLVGQSGHLDDDWRKSNPQFDDFTQWLPEVPPHWKSQTPPMTPRHTGLVEMCQADAVINEVTASLNSDTTTDEGAKTFRTQPGWSSRDNVDPKNWPANLREEHKEELKILGDMWHKQPYDLYHRPFSLAHMVPDPYWQERVHRDSLALKKTQAFGSPVICSMPPNPRGAQMKYSQSVPHQAERAVDRLLQVNAGTSTLEGVRKHSRLITEAFSSKPSMVPGGTLRKALRNMLLEGGFSLRIMGTLDLVQRMLRRVTKLRCYLDRTCLSFCGKVRISRNKTPGS